MGGKGGGWGYNAPLPPSCFFWLFSKILDFLTLFVLDAPMKKKNTFTYFELWVKKSPIGRTLRFFSLYIFLLQFEQL